MYPLYPRCCPFRSFAVTLENGLEALANPIVLEQAASRVVAPRRPNDRMG